MKQMIWMALLVLTLAGCSRQAGEEIQEMITMPVQSSAETEPIDVIQTTATEPTTPREPELLTVLIAPRDTDFVRVKDYIPDARTELKYGSADNFTGQVIYEFEDVFLRYGTVMKLQAAAEELAGQGIHIKIWDGFRPVSAQFKLWDIYPDPTFVANPNKGYSNHSRGFAVDLTLVDEHGNELEMPTAFDDFSSRADRDYSDCTEVQAANARLLESVMEKHGFQGYWGEWWHFNDTTKYDVETCFDPGVMIRRHTASETPLLAQHGEEDAILAIPAGEAVTVLGYQDSFALAEYWGYRGYIAQTDLS